MKIVLWSRLGFEKELFFRSIIDRCAGGRVNESELAGTRVIRASIPVTDQKTLSFFTFSGEAYFEAHEQLLLKDVDGLLLLVNASQDDFAEERQFLQKLVDQMRRNQTSISNVPVVLQYHHFDQKQRRRTIQELDEELNLAPGALPAFFSAANDTEDLVNEGFLQLVQILAPDSRLSDLQINSPFTIFRPNQSQ